MKTPSEKLLNALRLVSLIRELDKFINRFADCTTGDQLIAVTKDKVEFNKKFIECLKDNEMDSAIQKLATGFMRDEEDLQALLAMSSEGAIQTVRPCSFTPVRLSLEAL